MVFRGFYDDVHTRDGRIGEGGVGGVGRRRFICV